MKSIYKLGIKN